MKVIVVAVAFAAHGSEQAVLGTKGTKVKGTKGSVRELRGQSFFLAFCLIALWKDRRPGCCARSSSEAEIRLT